MLWGRVEGALGHHCRCRRGPLPGRGRPQLRPLPVLDQPPDRSSPRRGRGHVRGPLQTTPLVTERDTQPVVDRILALRTDLERQGPDAAPRTLAWHLANEGVKVSAATVSRILIRHAPSPRTPRNGPRAPGGAFRPSCPTRSGSPTSHTGNSPTAATWRS